MGFYEDIVNSIKEEEKKYKGTEEDYVFYVIEERENNIEVHDEIDGLYRDYTITNPKIIDSEWIRDKIIVTDSVSETSVSIDVNKLSDWLATNVDKNMYLNLSNIIFLNDTEKDIEQLLNLGFGEKLETNDLPNENLLGLMWYNEQTVLVNVGAILKCEKDLINEGMIYDWEVEDDINREIIKTLAHEIRHLAQANPFLPEEFLNQTLNDETDAEQYAEKVCKDGMPYIIQISDKEMTFYENEDIEI